MTPFTEIEARIDSEAARTEATAADALLELGEEILFRWIEARGEIPTDDTREGFRLLALHRQGAKGEPSFNACRETCRELVYHRNLIVAEPDHPSVAQRIRIAGMVAKHLCYFVGGKLETAGLGEFCCSSRSIRADEHQKTI